MSKTRLLARLVIPVVVATAVPALVAGEPAPPPATSVREWMAKPVDSDTTPAAEPSAAPARSIYEWKSKPGATPSTASAAPASSIAAWKAKPADPSTAASPTTPCAVAGVLPVMPATTAAAPAVPAGATKTPITISLTSALRQGNLVVMLDGVPVFNEKFQKPMLLITQTTTWDPLQVPPGAHRLSAKVYGTKKIYFSKLYDLHVSHTKGNTLRFVIQGDRLAVQLAS
jgi:hypothetical protein